MMKPNLWRYERCTNKQTNKQTKTPLFVVLFFCLATLSAAAVSGQRLDKDTNTESPKVSCASQIFVLPQTISTGNSLENFERIAALSPVSRRLAFSNLSNSEKAAFIRLNLSLQLAKRESVSPSQREFVLNSLMNVDDALFSKTTIESEDGIRAKGLQIENSARALFSRDELGDFLEPLAMDKSIELDLVRRYFDLLNEGSMVRMRLVERLPIRERVGIWKTQMAYHLATGAFSENQLRFISEMLTSMTPDTFAPKLDETEGTELVNRMYSVFSREEAFALFMSIGSHKPVKRATAESVDCECLLSCPSGYYCGSEGGCVSTKSGCGPWGILGCHYRCYPNP